MTVATVVEKQTFGKLEETVLPNGAKVYYRDSDHSYWRDIKANPKAEGGFSGTGRLTGVSTLVKPLDFNPDRLLGWVERMALEGVSLAFGVPDELPDSLDELRKYLLPRDPHVLRQRLDALELRWEQLRDAAGDAGTNVHLEVLHALATGEDVPDLGELPPEQRGKGQAVLKWWMDRDPEVLQAEQVVFSDRYNFAGRFDLRCKVRKGDAELGAPVPHRVQGVFAGETWLPDLKTGNYIANKHHAQVAGYEVGCLESGFGDSDRRVIVHVKEDGTYVEIPVFAGPADFLAALDVYRRSGAIGKQAEAHRKTLA